MSAGRTMKSRIRILVAMLVIAAAATACSHELTSVEAAVHKQDPRNAVVTFALTTQDKGLRYCLKDVGDTASASDVFRTFLQSAAQLKDRTFDKVALCFHGKNKFVLPGTEFKTIGTDYKTQNPVYTIRTFAEKLLLPDGQPAYAPRQGGWLYVMNAQMDDFNDMTGKWFMTDLRAEAQAKIDAKRPKKFAKDSDAL